MTKTQSILSRDSEAILGELGIKNLNDKDAAEVLDALLDHFHKVIIETVILNLSEREIEKFKSALLGKNLEEEIMAITAGIPGLAQKIEAAVENEITILRAAYAK